MLINCEVLTMQSGYLRLLVHHYNCHICICCYDIEHKTGLCKIKIHQLLEASHKP